MALELSASRLLGVDYGPLPYLGLDIYHTLITIPLSNVVTLSTGCPWATTPPLGVQRLPFPALLLTCLFFALFRALARPPAASRLCTTVGVL